MMKNMYLLLALCLGLLAGCKPADPQAFRIEKVLTPELMPLKGLTDPFRLEIKHPFLIVQNSEKLRDSIFHVYDLRNNELKCVFGSIGQGPKEYVMPWLLNNQLDGFVIKDNNAFQKFNIDKNGQAFMKEKVTPVFQMALSEAKFIHDSLFVINPQFYGGSYMLMYDMKHEEPLKEYAYRDTTLINYADDPNRVDDLCANKDRIVLCYHYKKQIDFMDTDFNLIKRMAFDDYWPVYGVNDPNDQKPSYVGAYLGKRYLYAIFMGCTYVEMKAKDEKGAFIEVFDLDGNPVARYEMQGMRPCHFAVDEDTFTLYGTGWNGEPEDHLMVYKLEGLK